MCTASKTTGVKAEMSCTMSAGACGFCGQMHSAAAAADVSHRQCPM